MKLIPQKISMILIMVLALVSVVRSSHATAQISDTFIYKNESYLLIGKTDGDFAHPNQFGMKPVKTSTDCVRGFYATYELTDKGLYLKELTLSEKDQNYLPIHGVKPNPWKKMDYHATYTNLNIEVNFTGKIRLAKGFIFKFYIHMGYQKPTAFKTVLDITLEEGKVVEIKDRSKEMEAKRGEFQKRYWSIERGKAIFEAFSLDMELE